MSQDETWCFSYGSNMSKQQMLSRTGSVPRSVAAKLPDYRLAFRRVLDGDQVYATIVPNIGAAVQGVAYWCSQHVMRQLDKFEGVAENCYRRAKVRVTTIAGEDLDCIVYIGESFFEDEESPDDRYLNLILTGAAEHQLPPGYIDSIAKLAAGHSFLE